MPTTERGPGGWPIDPVAAFHEAQGKFHEARKEADHWRANHADLMRRFKVTQTYRQDLTEGATLLRRAIGEAPQVSSDLRRAITQFLQHVETTLVKELEGHSR